MASEVFALTDEQILEIEPEQAPEAHPSAQPAVSPAATTSPSFSESRTVAQQRTSADLAQEASAPASTGAPAWLAERMRDPWTGAEAREFWEGAQKAERDAAAYREVFATPEDAKALKELYPGGPTEAKSAAEKARHLEDIDAAYFGIAGKAPEELSLARVTLAKRLFAQDPAAFREMVAVATRLLETPSASAANANENRAPAHATAAPGAAEAGPDAAQLASGYAAFERAANAELEKTVGATIARLMEDALPNLRHASAAGGSQPRDAQFAPLHTRLNDAVREEVDAGLKSDAQLGEQVAQVLSGRRFDEAARRLVVRLIDTRAQQLVPVAVRRVVGAWTQGTLGGSRKTQPGLAQGERPNKSEAAPPGSGTNKEKNIAANAPKTAPAARAAASGRVDYRRLSDEQILDL